MTIDNEEMTQSDVLREIRHRVDAWRGFELGSARDPYAHEGRYVPVVDGEGAITETTRALLSHWFRPEPHEVTGAYGVERFKYWPHQRRAVETFVYLYEVCGVRTSDALWRLVGAMPDWTQRDPWPKLGAQLATGAGKTKVMSLLAAWSYLNAVREPDGVQGLGAQVLIVAPGLFVRDRLLQDFAPTDGAPSVFERDPVVPESMRSDWRLSVYGPETCPRVIDPDAGALVVTNVHQLFRRAEEKRADLPRGRRQIAMLFEENDPSKLESVETPLLDRFRRTRGVLVIHDEAHHVWDEPGHEAYAARAAAQAGAAKRDETAEEAMAWIGAIRRLHGSSTASGGRVGLQVDLSATLYEEAGATRSKPKAGAKATVRFRETPLFRHTAVRYDLPEAIRDGVVKRPFLERVKAVKKSTHVAQPLIVDGAPNAWEKYKHLLAAGIQRWARVQAQHEAEGSKKPILFVLCNDRHEAAEVANFLRYGVASREEQTGLPVVGYQDPETGARYFVRSGEDGTVQSTVAEVHIGSKEQSNEREWDKVRASVNLIDREEIADPSGAVDEFGHPRMVSNPYNVVVSVMMLKEGWDVRNVKVIVPLRPCDSRTLTEQILGRGLRKMHGAEIDEYGAAELSEEALFVIEHPSFAAVIEDIGDLVTPVDPDAVEHKPEYVEVAPREDGEALAHDVPMVRYEGSVQTISDWRESVQVPALPELSPRRPWRSEFDETLIWTSLREANLAGEEFGLNFVLSENPTYSDFDHLLEAVYVRPLLKKLQKSHVHMTAVKSVVRQYLEERVFDVPMGLPVSFDRAIGAGQARIAMTNLARSEVSARVIEALHPILRAAMDRRVPTEQAQLSTLWASKVKPYQARKRNVYESPTRSVFTRAAMDSNDECRVAALLDQCEDVLGWVYNHQRVGYSFDYELNGRSARYIPDFVVRARLGAVEHHVILEVKGRFDDGDKAKARRGAAYARLLTESTGEPWHYVFLLENPPNKRKDISWWTSQSVKRLGDVLRRHELLPLYPSPSSQKVGLQLAAQVEPADQYTRALPVYDLVAAAGAFGESQSPAVQGWIVPHEDVPMERSCFVARMSGRSMTTPDGDGVPDGAWVVFRRYEMHPVVGALDGRRVLVELRDASDPEHGGRYTVKRLRVTALDVSGAVRAVNLCADNPEFAPIVVSPDDGALRIVAELVRVLG